MVLAFVGFMAGYSHSGELIWSAALGLVTTTWYTFLPSFLFIFAGAPIIEKTQSNTYVKDILSFVTAAIVGVIFNLSLYLAESVVFDVTDFRKISLSELNYIHLSWAVVSFFALFRYKIGMIPWLFISAVFGLIVYFAGL
jgi:chromate transporter